MIEHRLILQLVAVSALFLAAGTPLHGAGEKGLADPALLSREARGFRLDGPEIYKVNQRSRNLIAEDLNGDGRIDLAVVTNEKSILEIFYQKKDAKAGTVRFDKETVTLDRIVRSMVPRDVNGDGRVDLVVAAAPANLGVIYQDRDGRLLDFEEADLKAQRLVLGDLTGDGRDDVLVYENKRFDILPSKNRGLSLEPAQTFFTTSEPASDPMIIDFDGDGRQDIVYHDSGRFEQLVVRLQSPERTFPTEFRVKTSIMRAVAPRRGAKGQRDEVAAIYNLTRSLVELRLDDQVSGKAEKKDISLSTMQTIAFDPGLKSGKTFPVVADVDGDGREDVVVYTPDVSSLRILRQSRSGALTLEQVPSFQGTQKGEAIAGSGKEPAALLLYSPAEKALGYAKWNKESGRIDFPKILPIEGEPLGFSIVHLGKETLLAVMTKAKDSKIPMLTGYPLKPGGDLGPGHVLYATAEPDEKFPLSGVDVVGLDAMDLNRDGLDDLIVYGDFSAAVLLLQNKEGKFEPLKATSAVLQGLLSGAKPGTIIEASLGKDGADASALVLKEKFARAITIDASGNIVVEQQFNGENASSRIAAAAVGSLRGKGAVDVVLLDSGNHLLTIYGKKDGKAGDFEKLDSISLDSNDYDTVSLFDLDGDGKDDILLSAEDRLGFLYSHPFGGELKTVASASPVSDEAGYGTLYCGDILSGPGDEIIAIEMKDNLMELFTAGEDEKKIPALLRFYQFKMFDVDRNIARRTNLDALPEPRELVTTDLNGDGKPEIVTLMHDNIIVYYPAEND